MWVARKFRLPQYHSADVGLCWGTQLKEAPMGTRMTDRAPACHDFWRVDQRIDRTTIPFGSLVPSFLRPLHRVFSLAAAGSLCVAILGAPQPARAQCTPNLSNGGIAQNDGAPCTVNTPVTTGFGTAVSATNSANVTTNAAVTANGFGTGIDATTNSVVTVNGSVTAQGLGLSAASGSTIVANNIVL